MTTTVRPSPSAQKPLAPRRTRTVLLAVALPLALVLLVVAAAAVVLVPVLTRPAVDLRYTGPAAPVVRVAVREAPIVLSPSADGRVHVHVTGWSVARPTLRVQTVAGRTTVRGGCPPFAWFDACDLRLTVALPPVSDTTIDGDGDIAARSLTGALTVRTSNGAVRTDRMRGALDLSTTNGEVVATRCASRTVRAKTTNGGVALTFVTVPEEAGATATNGAVTVAVPGTVAYAVETGTTNGSVDTGSIRTSPASAHRIAARTTNGDVRIVPSGG